MARKIKDTVRRTVRLFYTIADTYRGETSVGFGYSHCSDIETTYKTLKSLYAKINNCANNKFFDALL